MEKKAKEKKRERTERRFLPQSTTSPLLVKIVGALGAAGLGGGFMGQYGRPEVVPYAVWVLTGGAVLTGAAIWIGTSGDAAVRVGDAGVAIEKGGIKRMPWWGVESVTWDGADEALVVSGKDESGGALTLRAASKSQPHAVAWLLREARARVPSVVDVSDETREALPKALRDAGVLLKLDPIQVVGKRCVITDRAIAYEPDARVCPRCERVYHKAHVPDACACGASLEAFQKKPAEASAAS
jgi:hypothetical protein